MIIMTINRMNKNDWQHFSRMARMNRDAFQSSVITCGPTMDIHSPILFVSIYGEGIEILRHTTKMERYEKAKERRKDFAYWRKYSPLKCKKILKKARESKMGRA